MLELLLYVAHYLVMTEEELIFQLHIATPPEMCREWHGKRGECSYKPET